MPMTETFTPLDLVALMYRELPTETSNRLRRELAENVLLREQYEELDAARRLLPRATFAPADNTVSRLIRYSTHNALTV